MCHILFMYENRNMTRSNVSSCTTNIKSEEEKRHTMPDVYRLRDHDMHPACLGLKVKMCVVLPEANITLTGSVFSCVCKLLIWKKLNVFSFHNQFVFDSCTWLLYML